MAIIYKITNLCNNKIYIGETIQSLEARWKGHIRESFYKGHGYYYHLHCAIRKYGVKNFKIEQIDSCVDEERFNLESYYIDKLQSANHQIGYNNDIYSVGKILYPTKKIVDLWNQGLLIKEIALEMKCARSTIRNRLQGLGIDTTEHQREAIKLRCGKIVQQYSLEGKLLKEWPSTAECGRNGFNGSAVGQVCNQKQKSAYGFLWKYKEDTRDIQEWINIYNNKKAAGRPKKKIVQKDKKNSQIIAIYESAADAAKAIGLKDKSTLCRAARTGGSSHGFKWEYIEE